MKNRVFLKAIVCLMCAVSSVPAMAQFNLKKAISGAVCIFRRIPVQHFR